ncbi:hypothetical protein LSAT2_014352 [Lamellibrachia satsuma]|nr:hypothetical protein LSAT2_014352 [Lamellibrachia satsuma]
MREADVNAAKITRIVQVSEETMFLSVDSNTAVFPLENGHFPVDMAHRAHFEVKGESCMTMHTPTYDTPLEPGTSQATPPAAATPGSSQQGRFLFAARTSPAVTPAFRRPMVKTFPRAVQLVEANLHPVQTIYLRLTDADANVVSVSEKLQEQLDSQEAVVLVDSKGMEIHESPGTQGSYFWKPQTRKILCMTESVHRDFQSGRTRKLSDVGTLKDAFTCCICKGPLQLPMFATCCQTVLACQVYLEQWHNANTYCPECRAEGVHAATFLVTGLSDAIGALQTIIEWD